MNTHQQWLLELQERQAKRLDEGKLTEAEKNRLQTTVQKESNSKSLMEAISEVTQQQPTHQPDPNEPIDEAAFVAPILAFCLSFL